MNLHIRSATTGDAAGLTEIYGPYVLESAATFDVEVPAAEAFAAKIEALLADYPFLIAERGGKLVGYAYGGPHRARPAYRFSVETSVYIDRRCRGEGIGRALYAALFEALEASELRNAYAGITLPNEASVSLHRKFGFQPIGVFPRVGYKFDVWHDVGWYYRPIREEAPS